MKEMLDLYSDYLISQTGLATATGLSSVLENEISHDQVTRFLNKSKLSSKELWEYVKPDVRRLERSSAEGVIILDDTIEEKPHTKENAIICWHYSHAKGVHVKGVNILSCLIRHDDISYPIGFEIIHKSEKYFCEKENKEKRRSKITKNEHFRNLIKQARKNNVQFKYVLADNWFGAKDNFEFLQEIDKYFIIGIKSNRTIALTEEDKLSGRFKKISQLDIKDNFATKVYLKGIDFPVNLIKKVFMNENGSTGTLYLISNDLTKDADHLYSIYQKRWNIEEFHKSIKQNSSLTKSPTKVVRSQANHIFASIIGFCKLQALKIKTATNHFALKYKLILKANQAALKELFRLKNLASA